MQNTGKVEELKKFLGKHIIFLPYLATRCPMCGRKLKKISLDDLPPDMRIGGLAFIVQLYAYRCEFDDENFIID